MSVDSQELRAWSAVAEFLDACRQSYAQENLLWTMAEVIGNVVELDDFVLYLAEGRSLFQAAAFGVKTPETGELLDPIGIPLGHGIVGLAGEQRQTVYIDDIASPETTARLGYISDHFDGRSELSVPVVVDDELVAVFDSESSVVDGFAPWQRLAMERMAVVAGPRLLLWKQRRDRQAVDEQAWGRQARAIGTFAGTLAHDLNNLLSVVELNAERLRRNQLSADQVQGALSRVVQRARVLTGRLLTLTSHGQASLEVIDVAAVLHEAASAARLATNVSVHLEIPDRLPLLRADPVQVPHIIMNLVVNALEAIGDRPGNLTLRASSAEGSPPLVHVDVIDDGVGMDEETLGRIFEPYFTTKPQGAGLGLASSYWAALQHEGDLRVVSRLGAGSTFSLTLPGQSGRLVYSPPKTPRPTQINLLVLDDDLLLGEVLADILTHLGHRHQLVTKGEDAVPAWLAAKERGEPFDLALLDLRNDLGLGGLAALERLRRVEPGVRAVAMSGYADETLEDARRFGFSEALSKPFHIDELSRAMAAAMNSPALAPR